MTLTPVQIVIGRGRQDKPMLGAAAWGKFQATVIFALADEGEFYRLIEGHGVDMNGGTEPNATVLGSWPLDALDELRDLLQGLREKYEQIVILLIVGELEVIA